MKRNIKFGESNCTYGAIRTNSQIKTIRELLEEYKKVDDYNIDVYNIYDWYKYLRKHGIKFRILPVTMFDAQLYF
jgi:hypothetical protein